MAGRQGRSWLTPPTSPGTGKRGGQLWWLLFRGLMLPRMSRFGRADWLVNGPLFACYHIAVHSIQTVFFIVIGLALVLR